MPKEDKKSLTAAMSDVESHLHDLHSFGEVEVLLCPFDTLPVIIRHNTSFCMLMPMWCSSSPSVSMNLTYLNYGVLGLFSLLKSYFICNIINKRLLAFKQMIRSGLWTSVWSYIVLQKISCTLNIFVSFVLLRCKHKPETQHTYGRIFSDLMKLKLKILAYM